MIFYNVEIECKDLPVTLTPGTGKKSFPSVVDLDLDLDMLKKLWVGAGGTNLKQKQITNKTTKTQSHGWHSSQKFGVIWKKNVNSSGYLDL